MPTLCAYEAILCDESEMDSVMRITGGRACTRHGRPALRMRGPYEKEDWHAEGTGLQKRSHRYKIGADAGAVAENRDTPSEKI